MTGKTTVVIIDDNPHIREIISSLISMEDDMQVAGATGDGRRGWN